ncbi:uncharacterized protein LOC131071412 isoform X3 [Cryptomeria japonica]|uniref:uncharacterized protein LOC131071412 isoform X3 n=1 Tax=Cryptomeria japonica TaxID=3369 RepID=UPI0027DA8293|nr:uncharacterized protein LOC131071412 isoform X3 [Cryptomeria japonica]
MVVKEALQKWAARVLRPWLQQEAEMEFEVSLFGIRGVVRDFNLNATSLNSTFMESSRLVIKSVTFGEVVVKFTPWRSPVFTLQIHGMRIVLSPRPLDDEFWENNDQQWTAEQERKNILLCIDPQGAALNAASERVTGTKTSSSCFVTMLTHMVLQCSRLVLHNTSIEVHIPERNLCEIQAESATGNTFYRCCIRAKTFSLEDGFSGHNKLPGGFLIAAMISALYSYRGSKGCKTCSIKDLGLELKRLDSCSSHIDSVNEKYVIFFKDLMVFAKLKNLQLTDLEFGILELRFGLYPRDMNLLMIILEHINYSAAKSAVSAYPRSHEEKCKHGMSSGNRWQRALENINRFSPKCRLQKLVEIVILRLRYAKAYESWLLELGMGLKGHVGSKLKKVKSKQFAGCIEGLWKEVCEKENKLPVEAVVQVRRAVRHRVLARLKKDDSEELDSDSRRQEHFLYLSFLVVPFSFLFQYLWKLIGNIYAFMFYSCSILLNSVYFFCPFLNKGPSCQPLVESPKAERQTHNFYDTKNSWYLFNASKLCYRVNICNVSITATCNEVNEMVLEEKIEKDVAISSIAGTSVLVLENLCLVYSSNGYVTEFSIVCEDVNGQIFSLASTERDINSGRFFQSRQSANQYIADNVKKTFLSSSSAPQVHCLDKSRNTVGRVGVFSISDLVLKDHQGQMWSDWESKNMKPSFHVGDASSTFTRKPFLLSEVQRFVIDPSPANSSLGLLQCNLALGQLFFDLDCSSLTYMILLLLQLLDAFQWTSSHGNKKPSHFSSFSGSYPIGRDGGWEELCNLYTDKMKQAMLSIIPEKTIHFTAAITGPKIQFSPFLEEYIKFEKQNAFAESHAEFSFVINLGNLEVAIWPAGQGRASTSLEEQDTYTTSKLEYIWLKKLPLLDDSRNFGSDFCMGHKQIGSNIYLKLDDAVMFLENTYEEKQLPLVKPLTITVESSVCRDEINSVLYLDKSFLASWGFTSSEVALICSVDELLYVIQIFEDYTGSMLDTFNQFAGRDKSPQQELCRDIKLSHNSDYSGSKLLFTSFKVVSTFDLETVDLCFEGSRGYFSPHSWKEVGASGYVTKYARRKGKSKMDDIWRKLALPNIDINLSVQKFVMEFSWVGSKQSLFSLRLSKIHAYVSDSITRNYRNLQNKIKEFKFRPVEETTGTHPRVLTEINFCNCTFSLCVGLHVYGHIFQEVTTRNTAGTGSSMVSQMTLGSACCALPHESYKMQLDEIQQKSPKRRNIPENLAGDLSSSVSRSWLLFEVDLSECSVTDSSLETLISEANKKISGGRRLCALFAVEEGFKSFSGNVQGGSFVLQTRPFSILIRSYRAYLVFLEGIYSAFMSSFEKLNVITCEAPGKTMVLEEGTLHAPLRRAQRSSSFSHVSSLQSTSKASWNRKRSLSLPHFSSQKSFQLTSGMHGVNPKKPFVGTLSFRVQQFSLVLAHVDASDGAQGVLLEMDLKTNIEFEKISFDLSRLMIIGLRTRKKVTKGKEKADYNPHFVSTSLASFSDDEQKSDNLELPSSSMTLSGRNASNSYKEESVQETQSRRESTSRNHNNAGKDCCILECMTASLSIMHVSVGYRRDAWDGQASISGVNLAFTTSEILMFLSLASPFSELSTVDEARNPQTVSSFKQTKAAELEPKIPNGAIVAVKDVEEHLYMAVEKIENSYRLIGVLHYTLVGDRALFMVKYNEKSKLWFSLLSVHARNHDGEPYCVHYHPGSSLIDVSSTKNNAWELWCSIPFKHKEEDAEEELDFRGHSYDKTLYFVNKKSNGGFAFVNGLPMLVKKPGNPLKLKTFQHADFQTGETERDGSINGQPSYELAAKASVLRLEKVNVIVEKLDVTILYETSGMSHFFPLFRACMDSAQYVLQVSSSKLRIISTLRFTLQTYEAQRNMWVELLNPVDIGLVYRVVGADQMQGSVTSGKIPIYFCAILKKVDVLVSEQSLDTCLFLFTELNLGGPYTIKHSPVKAYGCKIENCTGLDLLCSFEDNEDINVAAWQEESFLLRRMISRRGLHLESFKDMTFKLVKSGMVSSTPVQVSLEDPGVTTIMTNIISHITGGRRVSGSLVVIDVSKQIEDGFSVVVSPMVRIQNASDLSLELHCRRPQQREDEGVVVLLKHGESIDDSMGSFDALKFSGEMRKALLSFSHGNYVLCVRPATSEKSILESERSPSFEWSENLKGVKAVRISGLFEKLTYHLKKKFSGQPTQSSFSTIHCGPKMTDAKFKDLYFLVRTTRRKLPVTRSHASEQRGSESSTVAFYEQQDILILPTIHVSNLLEVEIAVSSDTNADEIDEHSGNHPIVQGGCKTYMYEDLSNLFLTIILCDLKQKSNPVNVGELGKLAHSSKSDMHGLDVELDFGDGKNFAMLRLSRGETGLLEAIIYTPYALKNDTDMPLVCFASEQKTFFLWRGKGKKPHESMSSGHGVLLNPKSKISWFQKSDKILIQRSEQNAVVSSLDLEFFSGFTEISLEIQEETGLKDLVKLGVGSQLALSSALEPTQTIYLVPRYIVVNQSSEDIVVCPKGLQETGGAKRIVSPGQQAILHMKIFPGEDKAIRAVDNNLQKQRNAGIDLSLYFQFSLTEPGWSWSGPICAASLGRFFLKFRSCSNILEDSAASGNTSRGKQSSRFAVVDVKEERSSLIIYFNMQSPESLPYQINNSLRNASILFHQKELTETEILNAGATVGYVWDDLSLDHELIVQVAGTQFSRPISLDKLCTWKPFHKRQNKGFSLTLSSCNGDEISDKVDLSKVGYEVYADGPIRILLLSEIIDTQKRRERKTQNQILCANIYCKVSYIGISLLEEGTKVLNSSNHDSYYMPIIVARTGNLMLESIIASKNTLCQFRVKTLEVDERWQGAPFAAMLRMHEQDNSDRDEAALHMSAIIYNGASNPYQVKYLSILLMAVDLNIDEDTLMKLVPFYRNSLAMTTSSKEIYFESFEIHPIKIIGSFLPGQPNANYTSAQETLRSLLHSVIKVPAIKRASVELNGILLSNALVTFRQLGIKCAQHYSWYIMRAIYIAKGSKLLPPAFASIFDDSASSSFHLFFDPSKGSVDLQGFTIGMFNLLRKGIKKKGFGTHRSIDLKHTMKKAGSNVLFAVITEVSDSVLKGAETSGLDGLVNGFRRGILKLAMEPSTLSTVIIKGSSTRRIKLDNSAGINEMYIEGYLQAMLDTLYRQVYVKVKVVDDQVILKNLPPSSALIDEIIKCTKNFLIAEGLLADKSSLAGYSPRRLRKDFGWRVGPQLKAVCEQLFIVFTIRALRTQTRKFLGKDYSHGKSAAAKEPSLDQKNKGLPSGSDSPNVKKSKEKEKRSPRIVLTNFILSSAVAYADGRLCRHIPNAIVRQIVSGFLLSFVE